MTALDRAVADMRRARKSHVTWAKILENGHKPTRRYTNGRSDLMLHAGSARYQRAWVRRYDNVLKVLRALRGAL